MHLTIEGYKAFSQDVANCWRDAISKYNLQIVNVSEDEVHLYNDKCIVKLLLGVGDSIHYIIENPKTKTQFEQVDLKMFFSTKLNRSKNRNEEYQLSEEEILRCFAEDDFREICLHYLPIIRDEILLNFDFLLQGDFLFETDFLEWLEWKKKPENKHKTSDELNFTSYQVLKEKGDLSNSNFTRIDQAENYQIRVYADLTNSFSSTNISWEIEFNSKRVTDVIKEIESELDLALTSKKLPPIFSLGKNTSNRSIYIQGSLFWGYSEDKNNFKYLKKTIKNVLCKYEEQVSILSFWIR